MEQQQIDNGEDGGSAASGSVTDQIKDILAAAQDSGTEDGDPDGGDQDQERGDERGGVSDEPDDSEDEREAALSEDEESDETESDDDDIEPNVTLKELADHLGIDPADVYDLEISMGKGETATLGELKDAYKEYGPIGQAREALEARESDLEKQVIATRSELSTLINMLPPELRGQLIAEARERSKQWTQQQRDFVVEAIPEWADEEVARKARADIVAMGAEYGFSAAEMTHTEDARTLKVLHDFVQLRKRMAGVDLESKRKRAKPNGKGRAKTQKVTQRKLANAIRAAKKSPRVADKRAVVSQLINQG